MAGAADPEDLERRRRVEKSHDNVLESAHV